ncbi:hypothetical protein JCM10212_006353 [Sporobolomyces blumeae]
MLDNVSAASSSSTSVASSSTKSTSPLRRFLSKLSSSSRMSDSRLSVSQSKAPYDAFAEIMALNARHGHPSVQAYSVKSAPSSPSSAPKLSLWKRSKRTSVPEAPPPPPYDAFDAIMRLNARHGHPSVQAHFVR